ncbi:hypothetical protein [Allorhizobium terrae]|uniref:Uncharacterized protein n=1 Tax=Allorhizobium terrae TaxID=1848972 RepID=A0A4S3ZR69_9HYPH|nr:hypothetical protein [Allorhizobium terrae]THF48088.1 hypothetical protein E6C51_16625 [Allorhizobium terrae]
MAQTAEKRQRQAARPVPDNAVVPIVQGFDLHLIWMDQRNVTATMKHLRAEGIREHTSGVPLPHDGGYDQHVRRTIESGICWRRIGVRRRWRVEVGHS